MTSAGSSANQARPVEMEDLRAQAIVVRVGPVEVGLHVPLVREVVHVPPITRLPFPPPSVPGVVSVRGTVLPVVDLGDLLFGTPCSREGRLVVLTDPVGTGDVALLVDAVVDLVPLAERVEEIPPEVAASLPEGWIEAVVSPRADRLVTLLNVREVLARNDQPDEEETR
jgi:chemotaxis signal transduction protein